MLTTSNTLLGKMVGHDEHAWSAFVSLYRPFVRRIARSLGVGDVDDLEGAVFAAVLTGLPAFVSHGPGAFRAWLRGVIRHRVLAHLKACRRHNAVSDPEVLANLPDRAGEFDALWDAEHDRAILGQGIAAARGEFSERTFACFYRTAVEGEKAAAVAEDLGMTPAAVYVARHRVQQRLSAIVGDLID